MHCPPPVLTEPDEVTVTGTPLYMVVPEKLVTCVHCALAVRHGKMAIVKSRNRYSFFIEDYLK
jgi:hypothetical protein